MYAQTKKACIFPKERYSSFCNIQRKWRLLGVMSVTNETTMDVACTHGRWVVTTSMRTGYIRPSSFSFVSNYTTADRSAASCMRRQLCVCGCVHSVCGGYANILSEGEAPQRRWAGRRQGAEQSAPGGACRKTWPNGRDGRCNGSILHELTAPWIVRSGRYGNCLIYVVVATIKKKNRFRNDP